MLKVMGLRDELHALVAKVYAQSMRRTDPGQDADGEASASTSAREAAVVLVSNVLALIAWMQVDGENVDAADGVDAAVRTSLDTLRKPNLATADLVRALAAAATLACGNVYVPNGGLEVAMHHECAARLRPPAPK